VLQEDQSETRQSFGDPTTQLTPEKENHTWFPFGESYIDKKEAEVRKEEEEKRRRRRGG